MLKFHAGIVTSKDRNGQFKGGHPINTKRLSTLRALDTGLESAIAYRDRSDNIIEQYNIEQPDRTITQRYVQELPFDGKPHLLLKSQKGTGKTRALKGFIERMQAARVPILSIGHRCTLLNEQAAKLNLTYYEDLGGNYKEQKNLAVTLDSLHKVPLEFWKGAVIVFDEASQVLKHLMGNTEVKKTRRVCVEAIMFLCRRAKHIVALDADMGQPEVDFFSEIVGRGNINVVVNTQQPTSHKFLKYPDVASLLKQMLVVLDKGKKLYFFSNSKAKVETVERMLKRERPDKTVLAVSSDNSKTAGIQLFMRGINQEVLKYQVVLASPSLGTGVDIETSHFHSVFAYITKGEQNSASDIMQGIARVRKPLKGEVHLYAEAGAMDVEIDPEVIQSRVNYLTEPNSYQIDMQTGKRIAVNASAHQLYTKLYCAKTAQHNASVVNLRDSLLKLIQAEGHSLICWKTGYQNQRLGKH